jgi:hypothetical protein
MKNRLLIGLLLITVIALVYGAGLWRPLEENEHYTIAVFARNPALALFDYAAPNNHYLHSFLVWGSVTTLGASNAVDRLPAYAAALLALFLLYDWLAITQGYAVAIPAILLLAFSTALLHHGNTARGYSLCLLETVILLILLSRPRPSRWGLTLVSYAMLITVPTMVVALLSGALWHVWRYRRPLLLVPILGGLAIGSLHYIVPLQYGLMGGFAGRYGHTLWPDFWRDMLMDCWTASPVIMGAWLTGWLAILLRSQDARRLAACWLFGGVLLFAGSAFVLHATMFARNFDYLMAPLALLAGLGWAEITREALRPLRWRIPAREWGKHHEQCRSEFTA